MSKAKQTLEELLRSYKTLDSVEILAACNSDPEKIIHIQTSWEATSNGGSLKDNEELYYQFRKYPVIKYHYWVNVDGSTSIIIWV